MNPNSRNSITRNRTESRLGTGKSKTTSLSQSTWTFVLASSTKLVILMLLSTDIVSIFLSVLLPKNGFLFSIYRTNDCSLALLDLCIS